MGGNKQTWRKDNATSIKTKKGEKKTLLVAPSALECSTEVYLHELNHIIETEILNSSENGFTSKCGFEKTTKKYLYLDLNDLTIPLLSEDTAELLNTIGERRDCEIFSEIVNDWLACDMGKTFKKLGIVVNPLNNDFSSETTYQLAFPLLEKLILNYKTEIISGRLGNDPNQFKKYIGEANFNKINSSINDFFNSYDGNSIDIIKKSIAKKAQEPFNYEHLKQYLQLKLNEDERSFINYHLQFAKFIEQLSPSENDGDQNE